MFTERARGSQFHKFQISVDDQVELRNLGNEADSRDRSVKSRERAGPHRQSLVSYLEDYRKYYSRDGFLYNDGFRVWHYTYGRILEITEEFAIRLQSAGVSSQDKVILWAENRPEWVVAFWSCLKLGAIVVPIDSASSAEFIGRVQAIVSAKLVIIDDQIRKVDLGVPVIRLNFAESQPEDENKVKTSLASPIVPPDLPSSAIAEIVFTSGTTGEPKGVIITHQNILANLSALESELNNHKFLVKLFLTVIPRLRLLTLLPLSHMFGLILGLFFSQMLGAAVIFQKSYNPSDIVSTIRKERVSALICVPKLLELMQQYVANKYLVADSALRRWWESLRMHSELGFNFWFFIVGGAPLPIELEERWSQLGYMVMQGYGLTESAPIVSINTPFDLQKGSLGKVIGGLEVKLASDGEILVRGDTVTPGYYNAPEKTAETLKDGWLHTGDIGAFDDQGKLYYRGRKKEMIVTAAGLKVFPEDVENILNTIAGVKESAVVGKTVDNEEQVHAVVVLDRESNLTEIQHLANERLEEHQKIRSISVWPERDFPRTSGTHKLKRREIRARIEQGLAPALPTRIGIGFEDLIGQVAGQTAAQLSDETKLSEDLGLSSLDRVELLLSLENRLNLPVDEEKFAQAESIGDVKRLITDVKQSETQIKFPGWASSHWAMAIRWLFTTFFLVPFTRTIGWMSAEGVENLPAEPVPLIFAPNHQSHMDYPALLAALPWKYRHRIAPAMSREYFQPHFQPDNFPLLKRLYYHFLYYGVVLFTQGFPLSQQGIGVLQTLRYMGELIDKGRSLAVFPEGRHSQMGELLPFQSGIGMIASMLKVPVVPVHIIGTDKVLKSDSYLLRPGRVRVSFGAPIYFRGGDYGQFARELQRIVCEL